MEATVGVVGSCANEQGPGCRHIAEMKPGGAVVFTISLLPLASILILLLQVGVGVLVYIGLAVLLRLDVAMMGVNFIKGKLRKGKKAEEN